METIIGIQTAHFVLEGSGSALAERIAGPIDVGVTEFCGSASLIALALALVRTFSRFSVGGKVISAQCRRAALGRFRRFDYGPANDRSWARLGPSVKSAIRSLWDGKATFEEAVLNKLN